MPEGVIAGVFIGGASRRFGGSPKGLLRTKAGETLVERWRVLFAGLDVPVVLVGALEPYASLGLTMLDDHGQGLGPLGGLIAFLEYAQRANRKFAVAVACDMPHLSRGLVERLLRSHPEAPALAARRSRWEPFCARYDASVVLPLANEHARREITSLNALLDAARAVPLDLDGAEHAELTDWDSPEDMKE